MPRRTRRSASGSGSAASLSLALSLEFGCTGGLCRTACNNHGTHEVEMRESQFAVYHLEEIHVADIIPTKYIWVVYDRSGEMLPAGYGAVYESLASPTLRQWVSHLPAGSIITTMVGLGTKDLKGFVQPCQNEGIHFLIFRVSA